ncbi:MAG: YbjN domain-containing protein [Pseudomonadota bacterium]
MKKTLDLIEKYLSQEGWNFERDQSGFIDIILTGVKTRVSQHRIVIEIDEARHILVIYTFSESPVPEERRLAVAEYLTRANYGLALGNFEMDFRDGEIRYKVSMDIEGFSIKTSIFHKLLLVGISTMDRYFPGLMAVVFAKVDPDTAIEEIDGQTKEESDPGSRPPPPRYH